MRVVVALGGNALLKRGEPMTAEIQRRNVKVAAEAMAPIASSTVAERGLGDNYLERDDYRGVLARLNAISASNRHRREPHQGIRRSELATCSHGAANVASKIDRAPSEDPSALSPSRAPAG
jgi:hypothetical protein